MSGNDKLTGRLSEFMAQLSFEPSKKDLDVAVKNVFNQKKKAEKEAKSTVDKPKRKLSAWNIFYKEQSAILKESEESKDKSDRMSAKEKMSYIAALWKSREANEEEFHDVDNKSDSESESEPEPVKEEPKPVKEEPKAKVFTTGTGTNKKFTNAKGAGNKPGAGGGK